LAVAVATQAMGGTAGAAFVPLAFVNGLTQRSEYISGPLPTLTYSGYTGGATYLFTGTTILTSVAAFAPAAIPAGDGATALTVSGYVEGGPSFSRLILTILASSGPVTSSDYDSGASLASFFAFTPQSTDTLPFSVTLTDPALLAAINAGSGLRVRIDATRGVQANVRQLALVATTVPEPASVVLMAVGGGLVGVVGWRRRRRAVGTVGGGRTA